MTTAPLTVTLQAKNAARRFRPARREIGGFTASCERRVLAALAARMPAGVQSDHLTALGFLATMGAGAAYAAAAQSRLWLLAAVACLALNWFGDSLDGTLARHRRQERPRYGFYIDHMVDVLGAAYVFGGLGVSGLVTPGLAMAALVAYLTTAVHTCLTSYTVGTFKISYGVLGVTELRLIMAAVTALAVWWPTVDVGIAELRVLDLFVAFAALGLAGVLITDVPRIAMALRSEETAAARV
jgi:phosphatidylglycerophosphate synthase